MKLQFHILIPARLKSTRLPNKPLLDICGKTMMERVYDCAIRSSATSITIVTGDDLIIQEANSFGANVCKSNSEHRSGTDRIAEAAKLMEFDDDDIILNLQSDEPGTPIEIIEQVVEKLSKTPEATISSVCEQITNFEDYQNPNVVKVVRDMNDFALYFSRAPIPFNRSASNSNQDRDRSLNAFRHIGLYGYRVHCLKRLARKDSISMENMEMLEQLRALWYGERIIVSDAVTSPGLSIDTKEDLEKAKHYFASL